MIPFCLSSLNWGCKLELYDLPESAFIECLLLIILLCSWTFYLKINSIIFLISNLVETSNNINFKNHNSPFSYANIGGFDLLMHRLMPKFGDYACTWDTNGYDVCKKGTRSVVALTMLVSQQTNNYSLTHSIFRIFLNCWFWFLSTPLTCLFMTCT